MAGLESNFTSKQNLRAETKTRRGGQKKMENFTIKIWRKSCGNSPRGTNFGTLLNEGTKCSREHLGHGTIVNEYWSLQAHSFEIYYNVSLQNLHAAIPKVKSMVVYAPGAYESRKDGICAVGYETVADASVCGTMDKMVDAMTSLAAVGYPVVSDGLYYIDATDWGRVSAASSYAAAEAFTAMMIKLPGNEARVFSIVKES